MPSIRIGFSTDLNLVNEQVGIGTTNPTARLDVRGQIIADRTTGGGGITTLTTYDGFLQSQQTLGNAVSIASTTKGNLNSISGEIKVSAEVTVTDGTSVAGGRLDSLTVTGTFDLPSSGTLGRELTPEKGSTRFNQDLGQLEFYTGYEWRTVGSYDGSGRGRGVFGGGATTTGTQVDYITISSAGNALDFGVLNEKTEYAGSCSSSIRGLFGGGRNPASINSIQYLTIASTGNAQDFGDLTVARLSVGACASSTRGVFASGEPAPYFNVIDYVQISTIGNALDFGDLTSSRAPSNGLSSSTRGIFAGGFPNSTTIDSITISSTGNAIKFGDLSVTGEIYCSSNSIRGIFFHPQGSISYITISSFGNSIDFGNYTVARFNASSCSSSTRGIFAGGRTPTIQNVIDYVTIASTGNAQDFGDLTFARHALAACSDSHGGLGGF